MLTPRALSTGDASAVRRTLTSSTPVAPNSIAARANLAAILAPIATERYVLEVVDCVADPHRALKEGVLVTPTLVKLAPEPTQTIVGSLSDRKGVTAALGLVELPGGGNE